MFAGLSGLGGVRLVVLACSSFAAAAAVTALVFARRRGGSTRAVVWVGVAALELYVITAGNPRPQSLVYPLFVGLVLLISSDSRRPSRRVLLTLPLLALWANLHGSVILAAVLVAAYSPFVLRTRRAVGVLLAVGPMFCVFASPYALELAGYYKLLLGSSLGGYVLEWQPTRLSLITLPFYGLAAATVYLLGRCRGRLTSGEIMLLLVTATAAEVATRNVVWFGLAAVCLLPAAVNPVLRPWLPRPGLNAVAGGIGIAATVAAAVAAFGSPSTGTRPYPDEAAAIVSAAAGSTRDVYTTPTYGDWLLWKVPGLSGRVSTDARLELLPSNRLRELTWLAQSAVNWKAITKGYSIFLLNVQEDRHLVAALTQDGHVRQLYRANGATVLVRDST